MDGPVKMYALPRIVSHEAPIELPTCMYRMKNIHSKCTDPATNQPAEERPVRDISHQKNSELTGMAALELRQVRILKQLEELKDQMLSIRQSLKQSGSSVSTKTPATLATASRVNVKEVPDVVINVDPQYPPYSILLLKKLWLNSVDLCIQFHTHSSIGSTPENARKLCEELSKIQPRNGVPKINIRLIWKNVGVNQMELIISTDVILGECNFLRYLSRATSSLNYDESNYEIDSLLDLSYGIVNAKTKTGRSQFLQRVNKNLGKSAYLFGNDICVADLAVYSAIKQCAGPGEVNANLTKWMQKCESV